MFRTLVTLIGGALLGALLLLVVTKPMPPDEQIVTQALIAPGETRSMPTELAEQHRGSLYTDIDGVAQLLTLPSEFARLEAMYVLAGRSDSTAIQRLIFEADAVADPAERRGLLNILVTRFSELDPESALALARLKPFDKDRSVEQLVWRTWARNDLDAALFTAKTQTSAATQDFAAQSLYAAFGYMQNDTVARIESELGIAPDRATRRSYLYTLADRSPAEAVRFVNEIEIRDERNRNVQWLAQYLSLRNAQSAIAYADLFTNSEEGNHFRNIISSTMAYDNPRETIERLLANGNTRQRNGEFMNAVRALVTSDLDAAMQYFEQATSTNERQMWGSSIAMEMAEQDPLEALAWARQNDNGRFSSMQMAVIRKIAEDNPELALAEAQNTRSADMRPHMVSMAIQSLAQRDPAMAATYLEQIKNKQHKAQAAQQLVQTWMHSDPDAALEWLLNSDETMIAQVLQRSGFDLVNNDLETVQRLLPRLSEQNQIAARQQIVKQLAMSRSPDKAQNFIAQFEGQPGYEQMQAVMISGFAQSDPMAAKQMADQISDEVARDSAYLQVISQQAKNDPALAVAWLANISDENLRGSATGQIAMQWYGNEPEAALRWVSRLPPGASKDDAIMHMSYALEDDTPETTRLIASVADKEKRGQAKLRRIYKVANTDIARAKELLEDEDISSLQRQQALSRLTRLGISF